MRTDILEQAMAIKASMDAAAGFLTDQQAARAPLLYPRWSPGLTVRVGDRLYDGERLYKAIQDHVTQEGWTPSAAPALYVVIDVEHEGTQSDPIPAARGMEYVYGLYYTDPEDGQVYQCKRTGEAEGGKIILQYLPHELVGQYFEEVTA